MTTALCTRPPEVVPGIRLLELPTPFDVGTVNAFLIDDDPLVLVDCGPATVAALAALENGLAALGYLVADIDLLVLTHAHSDHFGLAGELTRRAGIDVAALEPVADVVEDWDGWAAASDAAVAAGLVRHGMDPDVVATQRPSGFVQRAWGDDVAIDRRLGDGDVLELRDRRLEVLHLPGHSPGDTALLDGAARSLLAGDHLLAEIPSNAIVRPYGPDGADRDPALLTYRSSLARTRTLDVDTVLGGHGPSFGGHRELIDERLAGHERRAGRLLGLLDERPRSAHGLARELWGDGALEQPLATTSTILGHLDLLLADGTVAEHDEAGRTTFTKRAAKRRPAEPYPAMMVEGVEVGSVEHAGD